MERARLRELEKNGTLASQAWAMSFTNYCSHYTRIWRPSCLQMCILQLWLYIFKKVLYMTTQNLTKRKIVLAIIAILMRMQYSKALCIIYEYVICSLACLSWSNVKVNALFICCWVTCFSHPFSLSFCLYHCFPLSRKQSKLVSAPFSLDWSLCLTSIFIRS